MVSANMVRELGVSLVDLSNTIGMQESAIAKYRLKAAMYKALFFRRTELADKLERQIEENHDFAIGEFDGFCYSSKRASARFLTLEDMVEQGIISQSEYAFCEV